MCKVEKTLAQSDEMKRKLLPKKGKQFRKIFQILGDYKVLFL